MPKEITKTYLKTWEISGYYLYDIFEVNASGDKWLIAEPKTKGVTRTAENERILRIILQNDAMNMLKIEKQNHRRGR